MASQNLKERRSKFNCYAFRFFIEFYITVSELSVLVTFCCLIRNDGTSIGCRKHLILLILVKLDRKSVV